jgi:hypothetical protein
MIRKNDLRSVGAAENLALLHPQHPAALRRAVHRFARDPTLPPANLRRSCGAEGQDLKDQSTAFAATSRHCRSL